MSKCRDLLKYLVLPLFLILLALFAWLYVFSGELKTIVEVDDLPVPKEEIVFTVTSLEPMVELVQYSEDGGVLDSCYFNGKIEELIDAVPLDIGLFCTDEKLLVKVSAIHGVPLNPLENGGLLESDNIRVVVEKGRVISY